jgi:hypothetical protein
MKIEHCELNLDCVNKFDENNVYLLPLFQNNCLKIVIIIFETERSGHFLTKREHHEHKFCSQT